ncbi:FAD:protein FMN transferase [uncultured Prevotella sp.]|uniref:FAD:protein FMN transferase n=1 Tax=uncultured Prevotella sp. TaxID=159272 RepID=UPI0025D3BC51|nr:FAD:protein FMN transferase [uncultured Prevotella sp.]
MRRFLFIGFGLLLLVSCTEKAAFQKNSNLVFGTIYNITYQYADDLQAEIEAELQKVDGEFSMFNPQSTVARINGGDSTVERSAMFREIFELAKTVNKETNGAFDIHVAPLVNAWGFGFKHDQLPTPQQVDSLLKIRDQMDFSAIAKGYGCDVVARLLRSHGIENFMVEIGGEVVLSGHNDKGQPWHIGVNKPVENPEDGDLQTVLSITDCAIATSGNYRNFYYKDGQRYAHTIDPRTGYPVQHSLLSATVVAADCATADAYATSFMVLGLDSAQAVLNSHPELKAYLIYSDESGQMSVWRSETLDCEL